MFFAVTEAGSGLEALEMLRKNEPGTFSLILTVRPAVLRQEPSCLLVRTKAGLVAAGAG